MKFTSIFFKASESILEIYLKDNHKRAKTYQASTSILEVYLKDTDKHAQINLVIL